jgi:hypothetical protein
VFTARYGLDLYTGFELTVVFRGLTPTTASIAVASHPHGMSEPRV